MLEARPFSLHTDHKPLIFAFSQKHDKCPPRRLRQLDYISQFTTDIRFISGKDNLVADTLSRISEINVESEINMSEWVKEQEQDADLSSLLKDPSRSGLNLKRISLPNANGALWCDSSGRDSDHTSLNVSTDKFLTHCMVWHIQAWERHLS